MTSNFSPTSFPKIKRNDHEKQLDKINNKMSRDYYNLNDY